ncbi:MAG: hypothetical protein K2J04_00400 [Lachnospiraceae bacterium]|nr:hypothetical protein [Lachnospiraceae bacterium]
MELNYFKDKIFDLLNDADNMAIKDMEANDKENKIVIQLQNGSVFEIECHQLEAAKKGKTSRSAERNMKKNIRFCWIMRSGIR